MNTATEALRLALTALESCTPGDYSTGHVIHPSFDSTAVVDALFAVQSALAHTAESAEAGAVPGEWTDYLKEGETPFERFMRERKDLDAMTTLYRRALEDVRRLKSAAPAAPAWPAGLIDRIKAAEQRIADNQAPRRIPADPNGDVDLVLAEVRHLLEGKAPPFWLAASPAQAAGMVGLTDDEVMGCMHYDMLVFARQLNEAFAAKNGLTLAAREGE